MLQRLPDTQPVEPQPFIQTLSLAGTALSRATDCTHCKNLLANQQSAVDKLQGETVKQKKEALKVAIAEHLHDFLTRPEIPLVTAECSPEMWEQISSFYGIPPMPPQSVRPGHPFELDQNSVARESLAAASLVAHLTQQFRKRFRRNNVPAAAKDAYMEFALGIYPRASRHTIKERIRLRKTDVFLGGLGYLDERHELTPANKELAPANSISAPDIASDVEEESSRAILMIFGRLS